MPLFWDILFDEFQNIPFSSLFRYLSVLSAKNATKFVNDIFEKYDTDSNGSIDFRVRYFEFEL